MKGLFITISIIAALIVVGVGISALITIDLMGDVVAAHERGLEEGQVQGYEEGFQEGSRVGYQEGSKIGYEKGNKGDDGSSGGTGFYFLYNPTYDEMREILADGEKGSARELHDYAGGNGIRAAYVRCQIAYEAAKGMVHLYQLVAFETVDKGLTIIEPRSHREVKIELGKRYSELNGFPTRAYDDTITKITIVW